MRQILKYLVPLKQAVSESPKRQEKEHTEKSVVCFKFNVQRSTASWTALLTA